MTELPLDPLCTILDVWFVLCLGKHLIKQKKGKNENPKANIGRVKVKQIHKYLLIVSVTDFSHWLRTVVELSGICVSILMSVVNILDILESQDSPKRPKEPWSTGEIRYIFFDFNGLIYYRHLRLPPNEKTQTPPTYDCVCETETNERKIPSRTFPLNRLSVF